MMTPQQLLSHELQLHANYCAASKPYRTGMFQTNIGMVEILSQRTTFQNISKIMRIPYHIPTNAIRIEKKSVRYGRQFPNYDSWCKGKFHRTVILNSDLAVKTIGEMRRSEACSSHSTILAGNREQDWETDSAETFFVASPSIPTARINRLLSSTARSATTYSWETREKTLGRL